MKSKPIIPVKKHTLGMPFKCSNMNDLSFFELERKVPRCSYAVKRTTRGLLCVWEQYGAGYLGV